MPSAFPNGGVGVQAAELWKAGRDAGASPMQPAGPGPRPHLGFGLFSSR